MVIVIGLNLGIGLGVVIEFVWVGVNVVFNFYIDMLEDYVLVVDLVKEIGIEVIYI